MKLLLDTHMLLWAAAGTLPEKVEKLVVDGDNTIYFSAASIWEINIKKGLGRSDFTVNPEVLRRGLLDNQYQELPITGSHCLGSVICRCSIRTRLTEFFWRRRKLKAYRL